MAYLELKNFIHRDLAARNVLVGASVSTTYQVRHPNCTNLFFCKGQSINYVHLKMGIFSPLPLPLV